MTVDFSLGQIITTVLLGIIAWYVKDTKAEITNLRADIRIERDARGVIEQTIAAIKARCEERHKDNE